jgi:hypothetical protein
MSFYFFTSEESNIYYFNLDFKVKISLKFYLKKNSLRTGFEPVRENPNRFLVCRLNHSAIAAYDYKISIILSLIEIYYINIYLHILYKKLSLLCSFLEIF